MFAATTGVRFSSPLEKCDELTFSVYPQAKLQNKLQYNQFNVTDNVFDPAKAVFCFCLIYSKMWLNMGPTYIFVNELFKVSRIAEMMLNTVLELKLSNSHCCQFADKRYWHDTDIRSQKPASVYSCQDVH